MCLDTVFLILAQASFAQCRIVLDEMVRFNITDEKCLAIYNLPILCRLLQSSVSIESLRRSLRQMTAKHAILRTCLRFDSVDGNLSQYVQLNDIQDWFILNVSVIDDDNQVQTILNDEITNRNHFDWNQGRVFRCHVICRRSSTTHNIDTILAGDWIIFNFHHAAFDGESEQIFLDDLQEIYSHGERYSDNDDQTTMQYIDCKFN